MYIDKFTYHFLGSIWNRSNAMNSAMSFITLSKFCNTPFFELIEAALSAFSLSNGAGKASHLDAKYLKASLFAWIVFSCSLMYVYTAMHCWITSIADVEAARWLSKNVFTASWQMNACTMNESCSRLTRSNEFQYAAATLPRFYNDTNWYLNEWKRLTLH